MSKEHFRQYLLERIADYEAKIEKELRNLTQFNAYESPIDFYRGAIIGLKQALKFLDEKGVEE